MRDIGLQFSYSVLVWLLVSGKCCLIKQVVFSFLSFYSIGILDSVQFSSVAQSCPTLCDPMNCSTPGLPVQHHLHTVEVRNRFKGLDLIDRVPDELWTEVRDIVQETGIKTTPMEKKCKKAKWLYGEALQIAVKRREAKSKGEKER